MKKAKEIFLNQLVMAAKAGIMAVGMSVILCMSGIMMSAQAYVGHDHSYFGIAYLAEKEARSKGKMSGTEDITLVATAAVRAKAKQEKSSYDHEKNILFNKEMKTDKER